MAIVLAAGKGTRMNSELPKVLVSVCGRPMIEYVLDALGQSGLHRTLLVVGHRGDLVRAALDVSADASAGWADVSFVEQTDQLGTGHAVMVCRDELSDFDGPVLIVTGDSPLIQVDSVRNLLDAFKTHRPACLIGTTYSDNPEGLGRIVRDDEGQFAEIVEHREATPNQLAISEVNMSTYVFDCRELLWSLQELTTDNSQSEYYVTDCPGILKRAEKRVLALPLLKPCEALSINSVEDLEVVEAEMIRRK